MCIASFIIIKLTKTGMQNRMSVAGLSQTQGADMILIGNGNFTLLTFPGAWRMAS